MLPGLSYDLSGDQASYVVSRRQSQINSNVPTAGPNDVRQVTFNIADPSGFLDLSSLCFQWTCVNSHATAAMQPLSAVPHCCWSRMIISISSAIAEDIQYLPRTEEMLNRFLPYEKRRAAAANVNVNTNAIATGEFSPAFCAVAKLTKHSLRWA